MHAVFMTFHFSGNPGELDQTLNGFSDVLNDESGLVTNTWMRDGSTVGGFHVFRTIQAAERFLESGRMRTLAANFSVSDVYVQIFSTLTHIGAPRMASDMVLQTADGASGDDAAIWHSDHVSVLANGS